MSLRGSLNGVGFRPTAILQTLDTDSFYVPALAPSPAPAFSPGGELWRELAQARTAPRIPVRVALAVGAVVVLTVAAIGGWLLLRPSGHTAPTAGPAPATAQGDPVPGPNQARLMRMLPSGYSPGSCEPATTPPRALAKIVCTHNGDPAGPTAATYTLVAEKASLRPLFDDLPRGSTIVTCPGNIQSPGPWRRNATPQQVSGTLVCSDGLAAVTWTPEANLLVSHADRAGPALNQLYQWWSAHS